MSTFQGTYTAIVTPFKDGAVDYEAYERLIERQIESKVEGIVPAGCTGEAATLSPEEQIEVIRFAVERARGRVQVIAGTGSNSTHEAIRLTSMANEFDIQGVLVITPYYNKPTPKGLIAHYSAVADTAKAPVMVYNVPGRTGTKISPETIADLSKHPNIAAVKEACGSVDQVSRILSLCDIDVLSGDDPLTIPMMSVGAQGVVSVTSNVAPLEVSSMVRCALQGDYQAAAKAHLELLHLHHSLFVESNPIPVKTLLGELGIIAKELRLPLEYGVASTAEKMKELISQYRIKP